MEKDAKEAAVQEFKIPTVVGIPRLVRAVSWL
jgi:hypothetical protein